MTTQNAPTLETIINKLDAMSAAHTEDIKSVKGSISNLLGRVQKLESVSPEEPSDDMVLTMVKETLADEKARGEFLGAMDLETLAAAELAAGAELNTRLWNENKLKYAGRKVRQYGPTLVVGALAGVGGTMAVNRYRASGESDVIDAAEPADLKVAM